MSDAAVLPGGSPIPAELDNSVRTDNTTIGGNGTTTPLFAIGGGGGAVITDDTLTGNGLMATPLSVDTTNLAGDIAVAVDGTTIGGNGKTATPLHVIGGATTVDTNSTLTGNGSSGSPLGVDITVIAGDLAGDVAVAVDGTTIAGNGKTGTPLHTVAGGTAVVTDGTLTGNGTTGSPLHAVSSSGLLAIYRPPTPANGGTVALHAGAVNCVDIQNISSLGMLMQLPAANSVPAGTPLAISIANNAATSPAQRGPFTIPPAIFGVNAMLLTVTGADTINSVPVADVFASFTKSGDFAQLYSDGISDWVVTQASWVNITRTQVTLAASAANQISTEAAGPVPNQLFLTANEDGDAVISLSAGSFNQQVMVVNAGTHSILLLPGSAIGRTNNCCYLAGAQYNLLPGAAVMLQFGQPHNGGTPNLWWIMGQAQTIASALVQSNAYTTSQGFTGALGHSATGRYQLTLAGTPPADHNCIVTVTFATNFSVAVSVAAVVVAGVVDVFISTEPGGAGIDGDFNVTVTDNS